MIVSNATEEKAQRMNIEEIDKVLFGDRNKQERNECPTGCDPEPGLIKKVHNLEDQLRHLRHRFRLSLDGGYKSWLHEETPPRYGPIAWAEWHQRQYRLKVEGRNPDGSWRTHIKGTVRSWLFNKVGHWPPWRHYLSRLQRLAQERIAQSAARCRDCAGSGQCDFGSLGTHMCVTCYGSGKRDAR